MKNEVSIRLRQYYRKQIEFAQNMHLQLLNRVQLGDYVRRESGSIVSVLPKLVYMITKQFQAGT